MSETVFEEKRVERVRSTARKMFNLIMPIKVSEVSSPSGDDVDDSKSAKKSEVKVRTKPRIKKKARQREIKESVDEQVKTEASSLAPSSESDIKEPKPKRLRKVIKKEASINDTGKDMLKESIKENAKCLSDGSGDPKIKAKSKSSCGEINTTTKVKKNKKIKKENSTLCESGFALQQNESSTVQFIDAIDQQGRHYRLKVDLIWQEKFDRMLGNNSLARTIIDFFGTCAIDRNPFTAENVTKIKPASPREKLLLDGVSKGRAKTPLNTRKALTAQSAEHVSPPPRRVPSLAERRKFAVEQASSGLRQTVPRRVQSARPESLKRWHESRLSTGASTTTTPGMTNGSSSPLRPVSSQFRTAPPDRRIGRSFVRAERASLSATPSSPFRSKAVVVGCAPRVTHRITPAAGRWRA